MPIDPTVKVARDLSEIVDLSTHLLTQAVHDAGAQVDGTSLPGGRAMIALAPTSDTVTQERRVELAEAAWKARAVADGAVAVRDDVLVVTDDSDRPALVVDEDDDAAPALQILRYWSEGYRWAAGAVWDHIPTLNTEAKFLRHQLHWIATNDAERWVHFARDVNRARRHLENIVHAGARPDRSRVVCNQPTCDDPKPLIHVHGRRYVVAWTCSGCASPIPEVFECTTCHRYATPSASSTCRRMVGKKTNRRECGGDLISTTAELDHCPNPWCFTTAPPQETWVSDDRDDRWKCTTCKTRYDDDDFHDAHAQQLRHESAARFVALPEAIATLKVQGRAERTIRKWLEPPLKYQDQCTRCRKLWPYQEHAACPRKLLDRDRQPTGEECGGDLVRVAHGNAEAVVESWCDLATRRVWVWWPDLWRLHLATNTRARRTAGSTS